MITTLALIREHRPCEPGWRTLVKALGHHYDRERPIDILRIVETNGVPDALWCMRATVECPIAVCGILAAAIFGDTSLAVTPKYELLPARVRAFVAKDWARMYCIDTLLAKYRTDASNSLCDVAHCKGDRALQERIMREFLK